MRHRLAYHRPFVITEQPENPTEGGNEPRSAPMKWLTNCSQTEAGRIIADLCRGHAGRYLVTGDPAATPARTAAELRSWGMVGIYERDPAPPRETPNERRDHAQAGPSI